MFVFEAQRLVEHANKLAFKSLKHVVAITKVHPSPVNDVVSDRTTAVGTQPINDQARGTNTTVGDIHAIELFL